MEQETYGYGVSDTPTRFTTTTGISMEFFSMKSIPTKSNLKPGRRLGVSIGQPLIPMDALISAQVQAQQNHIDLENALVYLRLQEDDNENLLHSIVKMEEEHNEQKQEFHQTVSKLEQTISRLQKDIRNIERNMEEKDTLLSNMKTQIEESKKKQQQVIEHYQRRLGNQGLTILHETRNKFNN